MVMEKYNKKELLKKKNKKQWCSGDVKFSIGNIVSNIVLCVVPGKYLNYQNDHL